MDLICAERESDSPFVERIWHSQSDDGGAFISMADTHYEMVVTRYRRTTIVTVRGPETRATPAYCPADTEFLGIQFKPGVYIPHLPATLLMDRRDLTLPQASSDAFWLQSAAWQFPDFENADTFVDWLARDGLLVSDPIVGAVLQGQTPDISLRTVQRRFLHATGMTQSIFRQIDRARYATALLKQGLSILDTVHEAGYFDQPHMTKALKHHTGLTPAQLLDEQRTARLSLLYKAERCELHEDATVSLAAI